MGNAAADDKAKPHVHPKLRKFVFIMSDLSNHSTLHPTQMIDVGDKAQTKREARARGAIQMRPETAQMVKSSTLPKGNALETARVAAIMAAKNTPQIIPLCHPLLLSGVDCDFAIDLESGIIEATVSVRCNGQTGVEMEALTGVFAALLTIYDMTKGVDDTLEIGNVKLVSKTGGKSDFSE